MLQSQLSGLSGGARKRPISAGKTLEVAIATCSFKSEDFGLWEIYRINLNKLTFNIKNTFLLTNKFPKLSCLRQNRYLVANTCIEVSLKNQGVFFVFLLFNRWTISVDISTRQLRVQFPWMRSNIVSVHKILQVLP